MISPELLRRYPFFAGLSENHLRTLAMFSDEVPAVHGAVIFEAGAPAEALFFAIQGHIDLHYVVIDPTPPYHRQDFFVGQINPGEPVGISALIDPYQYTAVAHANGNCHLLKVGAGALRNLCEQDCSAGALIMRQTAKAAFQRLHDARIYLIGARAHE